MRGGSVSGLMWLVLTVAAAFVGAIGAQKLPQAPETDIAAFD